MTVAETLWLLPLLPVCVGGGRLVEVTATEVPDGDGGDGTVSRWSCRELVPLLLLLSVSVEAGWRR